MLGQRADGTQAYTWGSDGKFDAATEDYLFRAIEQTRRNYHVHSERIYLAGFCEGATLAFRVGLTFPNRFAGVISLNGTLPPSGTLFLRLPEVRTLNVFIGHGIANAVVPLASAPTISAFCIQRACPYPCTRTLRPTGCTRTCSAIRIAGSLTGAIAK